MSNGAAALEGTVALGDTTQIDPETLPQTTDPEFSFQYIDISSILNGRLSFDGSPIRFSEAPSRARRVIRNGDVIMSTVRPNLKAFAYCDLPPGDFVASTGFAVLRATEGTDPRFVLNSILSDDVSRQIDKYVVGSNYPAINTSDVARLRIRRFSPSEQHRIAEILSTVDEAIEQTERLIAKTQNLKAGLMHDLFTRGVLPDGRLRPPREEAPELYQESVLGWIPLGWSCETLSKVGTWTSGGTPSKTQPRFWGGSLPWVTPKDMKVFVIRSTQSGLTESGAEAGSRVAPRASVFIVVRGMILAHTFPVCLSTRPMAFNQDVKAIIPRIGVCAEFLAFWFVANKNYMLGLVTEATHGTKRIDLRDIHQSHIAVPPDDEQHRLVTILQGVDAKIDCDREDVAKLRQEKAGLMHDLLTGCIRVKPDTQCGNVKVGDTYS